MRLPRLAPLVLFALAACAGTDGPTATVRPGSTHADVAALCTGCAFDETFTRTNGPPTEFSRTFSADAGSMYTIDIDDLASQGADGLVTLDGRILLNTRAVTGQTG